MEIVYEDEYLYVIRKEAGEPVETRSIGTKDIVTMLKNIRVKKKENPYIGVINRLDQPVEGLLLVAKDNKTAAMLSEELKKHAIDKHYYVVCYGIPSGNEYRDFIDFDKKSNLSCVTDGKSGKESLLEIKVIKTFEVNEEKVSLVDINLLTGRHHQIRVQFASHGHPLLGDRKYGNKEGSDAKNVALCSYELSFIHPYKNEPLCFKIKPSGKAFMTCEYSF